MQKCAAGLYMLLNACQVVKQTEGQETAELDAVQGAQREGTTMMNDNGQQGGNNNTSSKCEAAVEGCEQR